MELQYHKICEISDDNKLSIRPNDAENLRKIAIVLGKTNNINTYRDLILFSNAGIRRIFKSIDSKNPFLEEQDSNFDLQSKYFLCELSNFIESLYNSHGLRVENDDAKFVGIQDFDKMELKAKLQKVVDIL